MKVNIDVTLQVSDEELVALADVVDGKQSKRTAKRDEVKEYVWGHGKNWQEDLREDHEALFGAPETVEDTDDGDDLESLL